VLSTRVPYLRALGLNQDAGQQETSLMADYMAYWKTDQVHTALEDAARGHMVDHAASEQFGKVQTGDTVWIVNIEKGTHRLPLVGRL